jgi:dienelactone hydrolase
MLHKQVNFGIIVISLVSCGFARAQCDAGRLNPALAEEIVPPSVALFELKEYVLHRVAEPPLAGGAREWTAKAAQLREHLLNDVVFHGWPREWVLAAPKFEDLGLIAGGKGYRLRKLRYEIVPGFQSVALLYEPENLQGKVPAIVNVNGHVGPPGKSVEYKQKRCINFARRGIMALNLEWLAFGELAHPENDHSFGAHLDLVGANGLGLFYLEMRKGLDYLTGLSSVDPNRLGVTGLSGGGWQTIVLSALDPRVLVSVPVAGYSATSTKVEVRRFGDLGDFEQNSTDLFAGQDYTHLTAMRAPRPTLLINNAEDDCCFRGPLVKARIFDAIRPFFKLYDKEGNFSYHENSDPGTHNYQLDNRLAAYRFFSEHFGLPVTDGELPAAGEEIKSYEQLVVGLPQNNLTILGLARKLAGEISRQPVPSDLDGRGAWAASERGKLKTVVRYKPVGMGRVWAVANTKNKGVETHSYRFQMNNGLSASGVWVQAIGTPERGLATIVLHDKGKSAAAGHVSTRVNRGEQALALDLLLIGDAYKGDAWKDGDSPSYAQILDALGDRAVGLQAAQLITIAQWLRSDRGASAVRLESTGIRNQLVALVATAIEPALFSELVVREGMQSLGHALDKPVTFDDAPELFCLDLYKYFDLDRLALMAAPTRIVEGRSSLGTAQSARRFNSSHPYSRRAQSGRVEHE